MHNATSFSSLALKRNQVLYQFQTKIKITLVNKNSNLNHRKEDLITMIIYNNDK